MKDWKEQAISSYFRIIQLLKLEIAVCRTVRMMMWENGSFNILTSTRFYPSVLILSWHDKTEQMITLSGMLFTALLLFR